jgi:hypothetical protein
VKVLSKFRPLVFERDEIWETKISLEALGLMLRLLCDEYITDSSPEGISKRYNISISKSKKLMSEILNSGIVELKNGNT